MQKKIFSLILAFLVLLICPGCADEGADDGSTVLHLTCWIYDLELEKLIDQFEKEHQGVTIEVKQYYDDAGELATKMSRMNAEIVTDEDTDLYYLESAMDVMSLMNAGLLTDLYPLMEADSSFDKTEYYQNIWESMELYGALYEIPSGFQVNAIEGAQSVLGKRTGWTIEEYRDFVSQQENPELILPQTRDEMLDVMMCSAMYDYIDVNEESCSFDCESFARWLEFINTFPETENSIDRENQQAMAGWSIGIYEYIQYRGAYGGPVQYVGLPCDGAYGPSVTALTSYGISSRTRHQELCWEFIKTLLSQEYQEKVVAYSAFPMRKSVFEAQLSASRLAAGQEGALVSADGTVESLSQEETDYLRELVEGLNRYSFRYADVTDIIEEEANSYFSGDKSAEAVAEVIQNRVQIYLSEHSRTG